MHGPMTLRDYAEAEKHYREALENTSSINAILMHAVRDSFHSLIGDIWVGALTRSAFNSSKLNAALSAPLIMWDNEIPLPTKQTALAWLLTLENPMQLIGKEARSFDRVIALPESLDPNNMWVQQTGPWSSITTNHMLEHLRNFHQYKPQDFQKKINESRRDALPTLYFKEGTLTMHHRAAIDNRHDLTADQFRKICVRRLFLLSQVLTPPGMPMTLDAMEYRGMPLLPWLKCGLAVAPPSEPILWGADVKLVSSLVDPVMTQVPCATPPLWFGFTEASSAKAMFVDRYFAVRDEAIDQLRHQAPSYGVKQARWLKELSSKGMLVDAPVESSTKKNDFTSIAKGIQFKGFGDINL